MPVHHDDIELEDCEYNLDDDVLIYPCPCGDLFQIKPEDLIAGDDEAECPSCSLVAKIIFDEDTLIEVIEKLKRKAYEEKQKTDLKVTN